MPHALIVDHDAATLTLLSSLLEDRGFTTRIASSLAEARASLSPYPDICMVELDLPDGDGAELLAGGLSDNIDFIMVAGGGGTESGAVALGKGARDCLTKPLTKYAVDKVLARFIATAASADAGDAAAMPLIGESPAMKQLARSMERIGPTDVTVLIVGESGTGKELIAHRLHALSPRARGRYLALNCGAVSPNLIESELFGHEKGSFTGASRQHAGYFERAHGGTLFLDEVTEMPFDLQVRLLRVLESRRVARVGSADTFPVNVRVIAATNRDPHDAVREGKLREDLLYRLQVVPIEVPPLRMRDGDVRLLAVHFLSQLNEAGSTSKSFSESALARLESYYWPGNVRELFNVVQRAYVLSDGRIISHAGVQPDAVRHSGGDCGESIRIRVGESLADVERRLILHTVRNCRTQDEAARLLGVSAKTLYNKLRLYESRNRAARDSTAAAPSGIREREGALG